MFFVLLMQQTGYLKEEKINTYWNEKTFSISFHQANKIIGQD
jgi:hypothetical protein